MQRLYITNNIIIKLNGIDLSAPFMIAYVGSNKARMLNTWLEIPSRPLLVLYSKKYFTLQRGNNDTGKEQDYGLG